MNYSESKSGVKMNHFNIFFSNHFNHLNRFTFIFTYFKLYLSSCSISNLPSKSTFPSPLLSTSWTTELISCLLVCSPNNFTIASLSSSDVIAPSPSISNLREGTEEIRTTQWDVRQHNSEKLPLWKHLWVLLNRSSLLFHPKASESSVPRNHQSPPAPPLWGNRKHK